MSEAAKVKLIQCGRRSCGCFAQTLERELSTKDAAIEKLEADARGDKNSLRWKEHEINGLVAKIAEQAKENIKLEDTIEKLRAALEPLDLTRVWESMPADVQRKISCHDLKRICNAYNKDDGWADIISAPTDGTVFLAFCPHDQVGYAFACTRSTDAQWICMMSGDQQFPTLWRSMPTLPARQALTDSKL